MAELTPTGYKGKTLSEYHAELVALYRRIDPNFALDPSTPDGLKVAHDAEVFAAMDEALRQAYDSKDPNKARGIDLDVLSILTDCERSNGTRGSVDLVFRGAVGAAVLEGAVVVSVSNGSRWVVPSTSYIQPDGMVQVTALNESIGQIQAEAGSVTRIANTMAGISSVTNPAPAVAGTGVERDPSLRIKRRATVGKPSNNQILSIYGSVAAVRDVRRVEVYENETSSPDVSDGNPYGLSTPHCYDVIVDGGADADVAMAIYLKKNPGTGQHQSGTPVDVLVTSPTHPSQKKLIKFSRPIYVPVSVAIKVSSDGTLPDDIEDEIRAAYMEYANGELTSADCGFRVGGFGIGQRVPYNSMFVPANKVIGKYGYSYVTEMTLNGGTSDIDIAYNQLSQWIDDQITVQVI